MNSLKRFKAQCKGSVAIVFAVAAIPLMVGAGMAIDYTRAVTRRTMLQNALDGAILTISRYSSQETDDQLRARMNAYIQASEFGATPESSGGGVLSALTLQRANSNTVLTANASASVPTTLMRLAGVDELDISVKTTATWDTADVVLVLDTSSASAGFISGVRTGLNSLFVDRVAGNDGKVQIGLVPYAASVRVPQTNEFRNADWILFNGDNQDIASEDNEDAWVAIDKATWSGCITDRHDGYDTDDTYYNNEYIKKYPALQNCRTGESNLRHIYPLTTDWTALKNHIGSVSAGGNTNATIGVAWGHALLSTHLPYNQTKTTTPHRRILILIGSGANNKSRLTNDTADMETRTRLACSEAKARDIEIYTVRLGTADVTTFQQCASTPGHYFNSPSVADAQAAIEKLTLGIRKPRLTH